MRLLQANRSMPNSYIKAMADLEAEKMLLSCALTAPNSQSNFSATLFIVVGAKEPASQLADWLYPLQRALSRSKEAFNEQFGEPFACLLSLNWSSPFLWESSRSYFNASKTFAERRKLR